MCGPDNEIHPENCICKECMPEPSYWNGIDFEWHRKEIKRREEDRYERIKNMSIGG